MKKDNQIPEEIEKVPLNMAMLHYIRIDKLKSIADESRIERDYYKWYDSLKAIAEKIYFKTQKKEKEDVETKFKSASKKLRAFSNPKFRHITENKLYNLLDEISTELYNLMNKYGMIFPDIKIKDGYENIMKKYDL